VERDGVVEEELRGVFENVWNRISREVPVEGARNIGEHECSVAGQGFGEDGRQSGECIIGADSDSRDSTIGEDENCSERLDVLLDLSRNATLVELVLLNTASVGQPGCVEDADLGKRLPLLNKNYWGLPLCRFYS